MGLFPRKKRTAPSNNILQSVSRHTSHYEAPNRSDPTEQLLYRKLRAAVPIIDAAIGKIVRLTGSFQLVCSDKTMQRTLDAFAQNVPVGLTERSLQSFADNYLDSLLTYGNALGEILIDSRIGSIAGLQTAPPNLVRVRSGKTPLQREYWIKGAEEDEEVRIPYPERILFTALTPPPGEVYGVSILHGLPAFSEILLRIYECIGQNYDRMGNLRYAVTYKPSGDATERAYAGERARQIAKEWSDGMRAGAHGEIRDFICAGDVDIRVIGADSTMLDTEVPVRQLLEQLLAKLSIPPFLLGLNWSSTERMSSQQADILTSELEYYRRLLEPMLRSNRKRGGWLMSGQIEPVQSRAFPVALDDLTFYATTWHLTGARNYAETGGASGNCFLTNSCLCAKRLILDGFFPFYDAPSEVIVLLENALNQQTRFVFTLRGMRFVAVLLTEYTIQENAATGVLPCRLTLVTTNAPTVVTTGETEAEAT